MIRAQSQIISFSTLLCLLFLFSACGAKKKTVLQGVEKNSNTTSINSSRKDGRKSNLKEYYADLLGTNGKDLNMNLYAAIDDWMDVPHRLGGMDKSGVDCSGFVSLIYENVYRKNLPRISRDMAEIVKRKYDDDLQEGDLVFFSFGGKAVDHVGIYLHNGKFVHVSTKSGVVISNLKDTWYYKYFTRCGTPKL